MSFLFPLASALVLRSFSLADVPSTCSVGRARRARCDEDSDGGDEPIPMVVGGEKMARLIFDYSRFF